MVSTWNGVRPLNITLMKSLLGMTPSLADVFRLDKMKDIYPLSIFHVQNITGLLRNEMIVEAIALLPMTFFLTALRFERIVLHA
jgi:hypothetical protein